jgi:hypothetical protein
MPVADGGRGNSTKGYFRARKYPQLAFLLLPKEERERERERERDAKAKK